MHRADASTLTFVRDLLRGNEALRTGARYQTNGGASLDAGVVETLIQSGAVDGNAERCRSNSSTRNWLKRQMLDGEPFRHQHFETEAREGLTINLSESPVARLAIAPVRDGRPFLERHHIEAAERLRRLVERAGMMPRMTTDYSDSVKVGQRGCGADVSDMAADARRELARISELLPRDCAAVAIDVCGFLKGMQQFEAERGWPRRSAKLVLRIALDCIAAHYGLADAAVGPSSHRPRRWMDAGARPERFE
ncbi:MAG TPA: DUF6456 domain-containing protein [Devosia sp.]|nr:DUF6456 domain-containing protein [Devosia sp.]